ncbi:ubiquitin specific peptidase 30 L homeolog [Xenopus laevis]|uniref:LOC100049106 protein n=1 Tax=Xenopus laevis TaxID=8355 RepID=A3KNC8_XENLA|nr:ubiquitin specific peptidase 30 L homeolog [Xenopus laevis]AAI33768.1 LOC100049106 protein [Xenopus laevis]
MSCAPVNTWSRRTHLAACCAPELSPVSGWKSCVVRSLPTGSQGRCNMMKNWGMIGGIAAALAAGIYVLWGPISDRKKHRKGLVPGLLNLGNTCFMNSLLQGLASCPSFISWLSGFTSQYREEHSTTEQRHLSVTLLNLLKALANQGGTEEEVLDASPLLEVLRAHRWQISSFEEQVSDRTLTSDHYYQEMQKGLLQHGSLNMVPTECEKLDCG